MKVWAMGTMCWALLLAGEFQTKSAVPPYKDAGGLRRMTQSARVSGRMLRSDWFLPYFVYSYLYFEHVIFPQHWQSECYILMLGLLLGSPNRQQRPKGEIAFTQFPGASPKRRPGNTNRLIKIMPFTFKTFKVPQFSIYFVTFLHKLHPIHP